MVWVLQDSWADYMHPTWPQACLPFFCFLEVACVWGVTSWFHQRMCFLGVKCQVLGRRLGATVLNFAQGGRGGRRGGLLGLMFQIWHHQKLTVLHFNHGLKIRHGVTSGSKVHGFSEHCLNTICWHIFDIFSCRLPGSLCGDIRNQGQRALMSPQVRIQNCSMVFVIQIACVLIAGFQFRFPDMEDCFHQKHWLSFTRAKLNRPSDRKIEMWNVIQSWTAVDISNDAMGNWEFRANPVFYWKVWQWFHHEDGRGVEMFHFVSREKSKFVVCALSENKNQYLQFCPKAFMGGGGLSSLLGMPGRTPRNRIEKMWLFKCEGKAKTRNNALKHILNNFVCQHFSFCWQHLMLMYWCTKIVCWLFLCCFFVLRSNRSCATGGASSIATPEMLQPNPGVREVAVLFPAGSGFLFTLLASLCSRHHIQTYISTGRCHMSC